jgi:tetratricopeptide (TPR) repeat protein
MACFLTLSMSSDLPTIRATESQIWEIWFKHPNQDVEELMQIGMARMNYNRYADAMLIFTQLVDNFPDYAEGWNRRATLHYVLGNFKESVADIEQVLALEPRHFGALSGLGLVYLQQDQLSKAKSAFESLIDVHPESPNAKRNLEKINRDLKLSVI